MNCMHLLASWTAEETNLPAENTTYTLTKININNIIVHCAVCTVSPLQ